jgi:hypothetical protein
LSNSAAVSGAAPRFRPLRAVRGLALGLTLSVLNLTGAFLTLLALGGLGRWTGTQFIGLFGLLEVATGAAFVIGPNVWRLPVAASDLSKPQNVRFAVTSVLSPHWAGGVKAVAGVALATWAAAHEGVSPATPGVVLIVVNVAASAVGLSMLAARFGCARPDLDVVFLIIRRPKHDDFHLAGSSLSAACVQAILNILTFPTVKLMDPSHLYSPEFAPSLPLLAWLSGVSIVLCAAAALAWAGKLAWRAPRRQRVAEEALQQG